MVAGWIPASSRDPGIYKEYNEFKILSQGRIMSDIPDTKMAIKNRIASLQEEIDALQANLKSLEETEKIIENFKNTTGYKPVSFQGQNNFPKTKIRMAEQVLDQTGHDLHVDEIVESIAKGFGVHAEKPSLTATLSRYANEKRVFRKTKDKRNTFGLLKWEEKS